MDINWMVAWGVTLLMIVFHSFFIKKANMKYLTVSLFVYFALSNYFFTFDDVFLGGCNISSNLSLFFIVAFFNSFWQCKRKSEE